MDLELDGLGGGFSLGLSLLGGLVLLALALLLDLLGHHDASLTFLPKNCHPSGPCNRPPIPPPISLCLSQVLDRSACSQLPTTASSPKQQAGANFTCVFNI